MSKSMFDTVPTLTHALTNTKTCLVTPDNFLLGRNTYVVPPWRHGNCKQTINRLELFRLHRALKHPEHSSLSKVIRQSLDEKPLP